MVEVRVWMLALCMLLFGSVNTIATKYQDLTVVGRSASGAVLTFRHPAVQSGFMFLGEFLCLIPYGIMLLTAKGQKDALSESELHSSVTHSLRTFVTFSIPAMCDAGATTLLNIGLYYTFASTFQMLRGTLVLFAGFLTIILLKRRLHLHHWMGMVVITAGAALVGASSIVYDDSPHTSAHSHRDPYDVGGGGSHMRHLTLLESAGLQGGGEVPEGAKDPLLGDALVVLAQLAAATQFIVEEKYLAKYKVPALLAVGLEGFWGLIISVLALPLLTVIRASDGLPLDDFPAAMREIAASRQLQLSTLCTIGSIAFFNFFGVSVTKELSGAARAAIDACRTLFIWVFSLWVHWETFHLLQVVGFVVLVCGTSLYNELMKACLPAPPESAPRRRRHRDIEEPLMGDGMVTWGALDAGAAPPGPGTGAGRPPLPPMARPRSIRGSMYTMARSMRLFPSALSPHSMASNLGYGDDSVASASDLSASLSRSASTQLLLDPSPSPSTCNGPRTADIVAGRAEVGAGGGFPAAPPSALPRPGASRLQSRTTSADLA